MKEIREILNKLRSLGEHEKAALATVVDVRGSSYRLPGAKMLVLETGETCGTVSGGCLETDLLERARKVIETGAPDIFLYDTTADPGSVFSLNMGCRGIIRILLEPAGRRLPADLCGFYERLFGSGDAGHMAVSIDPGGQHPPGTRAGFAEAGGCVFSGFGEAETELIGERIRAADRQEGSFVENFRFGEVFIEHIPPVTELCIYGAGADAVPLSRIGASLGWRVSVIDHRPALSVPERFPEAERVLLSTHEDPVAAVGRTEHTVAVVMTHNYEQDKRILRSLLQKNLAYVGALGPKRRAENILRELREEGLELTDRELVRFHAPVGLDIGADTPEGIALSVAAEIRAVLSGRRGGFLRDREGSIYGRNE